MSICVYRLKPRRREAKFDLGIAAVVLFLYCSNRFFNLFANILSEAFLNNHFNDLCAGILFPAYVNLLLLFFRTSFRIEGFRNLFSLELICSIAWEFFTPIIWSESTGDWIDVAMYFIGGALYGIARELRCRCIKRGLARDGDRP